MANNKENLIAAIPAIQPIYNKDLRRVASGYGMRIDPFLKVRRMHYGLDFSVKKGTPIYATADGEVVIIKSSFGGLGKHIYLDHDLKEFQFLSQVFFLLSKYHIHKFCPVFSYFPSRL